MSDPTKLHEDQAVRVWSRCTTTSTPKTVVASCNQHSASAWIRSGQGLAAPGRGSMTLRDIADANGLDAPYATVICDSSSKRAW